MKKLYLYLLLAYCLVSFVSSTFADEHSQALKPILEIKQILLPRVAEDVHKNTSLSGAELKEKQKIKREKKREESRLINKKQKLLISMAKTND